ncbi:MAG: 16S rRNA pseudouridine(516) synthase [Clostridia bacterium]|nr:16S rRNA pseudouridine(516) synthase [Clostridia bacterium]MBQ5743056.1 16S rRNA pseudouridine(516) synthase [Clostridia bacterium]
MRLDAACALGTGKGRKECRDAIRKGWVTVDGNVVKKADFSVTEQNTVAFGGTTLDLREHLYFMLHKPAGTVSTTEDIPESVLNLFPEKYRKRLFCVGRLDKDTTGLLFLTDDGAFDHRLMSPKHHAEKEYQVTLARPLSEGDVSKIEAGMTLENGETTLPCRVETQTDIQCIITLCEGKYHQVKRMFAAVGNRVIALHRRSVGGVLLDERLEAGEYRELTAEERSLLS